MAQRTLSTKLSLDGLQDLLKGFDKVQRGFDEMLDDVGDSLRESAKIAQNAIDKGLVDALEDANKSIAKEAKKTQQILSQSFKSLGFASEADIDKQKNKLISAYNAIKNSGVASATDIKNAQAQLERQLEKLDQQLDQTNRKAKDTGGGFTIMKGAIATAIGGAALQGLQRLTAIVSEGGESALQASNDFLSFRQQLTRIEGDAAGAENTLKRLEEFAATTPSELNEVIQAYTSLANRGIKPTNDQLRNMLDLASSQRKGLGQLVEAQLDAQTGEFERLKEFGIKASKAGDQVTLTFGKTTYTVKNTAEEINNAILKFGQLPSIAGASLQAMDRLDGKASNFADSWNRVSRAIGDALTPLASGAFDFGSGLFGELSDESLFRPVAEAIDEIVTELKIATGSTDDFAKIVAGELRQSLRDVATIISSIAEYLRQNPSTVRDWGEASKVVLGILKLIGNIVGFIVGLVAKLLNYWVQVVAQASRLNNLAQQGFSLMRKDVDAIGAGIGNWIKKINDAAKPLRDFADLMGSIAGGVIQVGTDIGKKVGNAARGIAGNQNGNGPLLPAPGGAFHPSKFPITSPMGMRNGRPHNGTDYGTPQGTALANIFGAGVISYAGPADGYGNLIELTTNSGDVYRFGHISQIGVRTGQFVPAGAMLGLTGGAPGTPGAGRSTGPHLHLEYMPKGGAPVPFSGGPVGRTGCALCGGNHGTLQHPIARGRPKGKGGPGPQELRALKNTAKRLGIKPEDLYAVIKKESGFSPSITNDLGATGLIQFMPDTAKELGTSTDALRKMSSVQQLQYVEKYLKGTGIGAGDGLAQIYAAILTGSKTNLTSKDANGTNVNNTLPQLKQYAAEGKSLLADSTKGLSDRAKNLKDLAKDQEETRKTTKELREEFKEFSKDLTSSGIKDGANEEAKALLEVEDKYDGLFDKGHKLIDQTLENIKVKKTLGQSYKEENALLGEINLKLQELNQRRLAARESALQQLAAEQRLTELERAANLAEVRANTAQLQVENGGGYYAGLEAKRLQEDAFRAQQSYQLAQLDKNIAAEQDPRAIAYLKELKGATEQLNQARLDQYVAQLNAIEFTVDDSLVPALTKSESAFDGLGETLKEATGNALSQIVDIFSNLLTGTQDVGQALLGIISGFLKTIAQFFLNKAIAGILGSLFGGGGNLFAGSGLNLGGASYAIGPSLGSIPAFAGGGLLKGKGTDTSDSNLAWFSNNEYIFNAAAVRYWGVGVLDSMNARVQPVGYASGGLVGDGPQSSSPYAGVGAGISMPITVYANDADSFRKSESQIRREMAEGLFRSGIKR